MQGDMRSSGEIRMFKLGVEADEFCIVFTSDYCDHVRKANTVASVNKLVIGMITLRDAKKVCTASYSIQS